MIMFEWRELRQALDYAARGGQSLHLHRFIHPKAPPCFRQAVARGEQIAHLFGQDKERLIATAKRLGVKVIVVERESTSKQHIDLCGKPLQRAIQQLLGDYSGST